jgi:hypothetical protein
VKSVKINKKYSTLLLATFMTLAMDFAMTLTMTIAMTGIDPGFLIRFFGGYVIGLIVGIPTSVLVIPYARKLVEALTTD